MTTSASRDVSPLFIRGSTGLVREVKAVDQFIFNACLVNLGLAGVFIFEFGPFARPHGNIYLITLIAGIGFLWGHRILVLVASVRHVRHHRRGLRRLDLRPQWNSVRPFYRGESGE
jgi:hypothetical protein